MRAWIAPASRNRRKGMKIMNQDRDRVFSVRKVWYKAHRYKGIMWGWNIYGRGMLGMKHLLGTRDTKEEAEQIVGEIKRLMAKCVESYTMPELASDEILEEILEGGLQC